MRPIVSRAEQPRVTVGTTVFAGPTAGCQPGPHSAVYRGLPWHCTIENHLTSTYGKLGISSRPVLAAALKSG